MSERDKFEVWFADQAWGNEDFKTCLLYSWEAATITEREACGCSASRVGGEPVVEKLCAFCEHFDWDSVSYHYYSTLTGGDLEGGASCKKFHFREERPDNNEELRALFLKAETCCDYLPPVIRRDK